MQVVKIQFLLTILGTIIIIILSGNYEAYILGSLTVIIPTILYVICWKSCGYFVKRNGLAYLMLAHLIKIFLVLLVLYLVIKHHKDGNYMTIFAGFIISCKAYLLAGLSLKKR